MNRIHYLYWFTNLDDYERGVPHIQKYPKIGGLKKNKKMPFKIIEFNSFCFTLKEPKESPSHIPPPKNTVDPSIHPFVPAFQMVLATAKVVAKVTPKHQSQRRKPSNGSVVERARNESVWGIRLVKKLWGLQTCVNHSNLFKSIQI